MFNIHPLFIEFVSFVCVCVCVFASVYTCMVNIILLMIHGFEDLNFFLGILLRWQGINDIHLYLVFGMHASLIS